MSLRSPRRLLIAGAAGFIGSNFVRLLRSTAPDVEITVLDKLTYAGNPANLAEFEGQPGYRFVHGDICDAKLVNSLAREADAIVNFAAETHVDRSLMDPFAFIETDVRGTALGIERPDVLRMDVAPAEPVDVAPELDLRSVQHRCKLGEERRCAAG